MDKCLKSLFLFAILFLFGQSILAQELPFQELFRQSDYGVYVYYIPFKTIKKGNIDTNIIAEYVKSLPVDSETKTYKTVFFFTHKPKIEKFKYDERGMMSYHIGQQKPLIEFFSSTYNKPEYKKANVEMFSIIKNGCVAITAERNHSTNGLFKDIKPVESFGGLLPCK